MNRAIPPKSAPTPAAIHAAELRVMQSAQDVGDGLRRLRLVFRATMARPSTLVKAAGVTAVFSFWLARRLRTPHPGKGLWEVAMVSLPGLMLANIVRYGRRRLRTVFR